MKLRHVVIAGFAILGALVVLHVYMQHGGVSGLKATVGFGG